MAMSLIGSGVNSPYQNNNQEYMSIAFTHLIDSHRTYLLQQSTTTTFSVTATEANKYQGDFYGLLQHNNVPPKLWYATMRLTGLNDPTSNTVDLRLVFVPGITEIESLMQRLKRKP